MIWLCLLAALAAAPAWAQPSLAVVVNAASNLLPGLPNAAIAQGAMFVGYGSGIGPAAVALGAFPLSTTLSGTSVRVTVEGVTVNAIMIYTLATQFAAVLPSSTPTGAGTIAVTYNGQTSAPLAIVVVPHSFGIFTVSQNGEGAGIVTYADYTVVTADKAANPAEALIIWGTGEGAVPGDEAGGPLPGDRPEHPVEVWVGGQQATVLYRGRSGCCAGLDQIVFLVPAGVSGCVVPLVVKTNLVVSNTATIAIAASGRRCRASNPGLSTSDVDRLLARPTIAVGGVVLARSATVTTASIPGFPPVTNTTRDDVAAATFLRAAGPPAFALGALADVAAFGSCLVSPFSGREASSLPGLALQGLDAGLSLLINGPPGNRQLGRQSQGGVTLYSSMLGNGTPGNYLDPGQYAVTGTGGADVGSFNVRFNVPPPVNFAIEGSLTAVTRASGVTVTWSGGDPAGYVEILGASFVPTTGNNAVGASFVCTARVSEGFFTVPPVVLLALPPSASEGGAPVKGTLGVSSVSNPVAFTVSGLDFASAAANVAVVQAVIYE